MRRFLVPGILVAGLLWRLFLSFVFVPAWEARANVGAAPDAYPVLARSLVEQGELGYAPYGASPTTVRGPGFPAWLGLGFVAGGENPHWLGFWGGLPGLFAGLLLALMIRRRHGELAALVAGSVAVLHPLPSLIASRAMGDDFYGALGFAALAAWSVALGTRDGKRRWIWTGSAGLLLALQMLSRSSGLLTLVAAVALGLFSDRRGTAADRGRESTSRPLLVATLIAVALLPPLLWSVRSSRLEGRPVFVHSLTAYNFWVGEGFDRYGTGEPPAGNWPRILELVLAEGGVSGERAERFWYGTLEPPEAAELESRLTRAALTRVTSDPLGYLWRSIKGLGRYWFQAQTAARSLQYLVLVLPVLLLACLGVRPVLAGDTLGRLLLATLLLHNVAYAAMLPMARMSVQVYPCLAYLAGVGAIRLTRRFRGIAPTA